VVLGLSNKHPLSEPEVGNLLLGELRCAACHGWKAAEAPLERAAPNLSDVGSRPTTYAKLKVVPQKPSYYK